MTSKYLHNYLRKYRKRSALSQEEVAFLLGSPDGTNVCRHERLSQQPDLQTALAYGEIFHAPVSELFPGIIERVQMEVRARAKELEQKDFCGNTSRVIARKRETLATIASVESKNESQQ